MASHVDGLGQDIIPVGSILDLIGLAPVNNGLVLVISWVGSIWIGLGQSLIWIRPTTQRATSQLMIGPLLLACSNTLITLEGGE